MAPWPDVSARLLDRAIARTHRVTDHFAITCLQSVEIRLQLLLWHLADRWGKVDRGGVVLPLPLTHSALARLVRARRPSVSLAVKSLSERGVVSRNDDGGWLLRGEPPELRSS